MTDPIIWAGVVLQKQPTDRTCVHTCLAMLLNRPVEQVITALVNNFGRAYADDLGHHELNAALRFFGIMHVPLAAPSFVIEGWHLAVVPSLNIPGGNHQILVHNTLFGPLRVFDPSTQQVYDYSGRNLHCWTELIFCYPTNATPKGT